MNAHYGGLSAAFLEARLSVWVMNVVPVGAQNTLPLILNQGFAGVYHDWYAQLLCSMVTCMSNVNFCFALPKHYICSKSCFFLSFVRFLKCIYFMLRVI